MKKNFMILKINIKKILLISFLLLIFTILFFPEHLLKLDRVNKLIKNLGFELNYIQVLGNKTILKDEIIKNIVFKNCDSLFCVNLKQSKNEIEKNNWVRSAKLKYSLPSKLSIIIEEEKPMFLLKEKKKITLLNLEGKKIQDIKTISTAYKDLLILSGDGVENKIFNLQNIFSVGTSVSENIKEATLISSRRWSLKHSSNIIIELPEDNPSKAFYKIVELENKYGFLNEKLKKIDLRISDRMIIQLKNKSELIKENDI
ncbi:MAG: FtsQ-type POTRA domain-containing protein [Alphaproteobacteria bacterium TMED194]|nr:MAG: FtsQ-type POTRA domain-containing protein [Alphaproteobacteria bacterium TMED194]